MDPKIASAKKEVGNEKNAAGRKRATMSPKVQNKSHKVGGKRNATERMGTQE